MKKQICVICGETFSEWPNNAMPVKEGKCCEVCNEIKVIPARVRMIEEQINLRNN